jgi:hypothetical protein
VRFGVITFTVLGLLFGSLIVAAGILRIRHLQAGRPTLVVQVIMYTFLALISVFGLMATIMRRRRLVAIFWAMLTAHLIFSIISGSFTLHAIFKNAPANMENCIATQPDDPDQESHCRKAEVAVKGAFISVFIIIWLFQIYACLVIDKYTKQLAEEEDAMFKEETGRPTW